MDGKELTKPTPTERFLTALKEYAQTEFPGQSVIVSEWAAILYVEAIDQQGNPDNNYLYVTSPRSSWHSLRGLGQTLADHIYRQRT